MSDPEKASKGKIRSFERIRIADWLDRWANTHIRDPKATTPDRYAANVVKRLARHIKNASAGDLTFDGDTRQNTQGRADYINKVWRPRQKAAGKRFN